MDRAVNGARNIQPAADQSTANNNPRPIGNPIANAAHSVAQNWQPHMPGGVREVPLHAVNNSLRLAQTQPVPRLDFLSETQRGLLSSFAINPDATFAVDRISLVEMPYHPQAENLSWLFLRNRPHVQHIDLSRCRHVSDNALEALLLCFPNAITLNVTDNESLSDFALHIISERLPSLESLNLQGCERITGIPFKLGAIRLRKLESLSLVGCVGLVDDSFRQLDFCFPNLKSLDLSGCKQLNESAFISLADRCPPLTSLYLSQCFGLSNRAFLALADALPNLQNLSAHYCKNLSDELLLDSDFEFPKLAALDLSSINQLTDVGLKNLPEICWNLESLTLYGNKAVTKDTLFELVEGLPELITLNVSGCKYIGPQEIRDLSAAYPRLSLQPNPLI